MLRVHFLACVSFADWLCFVLSNLFLFVLRAWTWGI